MKTVLQFLIFFFCLTVCSLSPVLADQQAHGTARAILFFKHDCPDCEKVRLKILPRLKAKFGNRLEILTLNTSSPEAGTLYLQTLISFNIPHASPLPQVIMGRNYWSGSRQITDQLPTAVKSVIAGGGSDWPALKGLPKLLDQLQNLKDSERSRWFISENPEVATFMLDSFRQKFRQDITGNSYAFVLLSSMIISLVYAVLGFVRRNGEQYIEITAFRRWLILLLLILGIAIAWQLAEIDRILQGIQPPGHLLSEPFVLLVLVATLIGFLVSLRTLFGNSEARISSWQRWFPLLLLGTGTVAAGYLVWAEIVQVKAVCGAVGDCNTVQQSEYARLFGFVSVAVLGILGNFFILAAWLCGNFGPERFRDAALLFMWGLLFIGVCFFVYLTFLEPFVIGATCFWCLTAATAMTLQLLMASIPASQALYRISR